MSEEWFSSSVIANGIKTHYYRTGDGKPPVVLSHGITDNGLCWTQLARALEKDYDVIMYDVRGHGLSDAPQEGYTYEALSGDLAGLIRALDLEHTRLIGHSMGAVIVAATAAIYPDLVRCAILEDPPWSTEVDTLSNEQLIALAEAWRTDSLEMQSRSRDEIIALGRADNPTWPEGEFGPWAESKLQVSPHVFQLISEPQTPWKDFLERIKCPVLLLTGDPDRGAVVTPSLAQEVSRISQDGKVVRISGAGHCIRREQPRRYIEEVSAFLKEAGGHVK